MILVCANCGQKNRVPAARLDAGPVCGNCKQPLNRFGRPVDIDGAEFEDAIRHAPVPVFVDFWAPWCGPCRVVAPEIVKLAERHPDDLLVLKLNTQEHPEPAARYEVRGIPMFALFRDGELVHREVGAMSATDLEARFGL